MTRRPSDQAWRASALATALFAITLNFLQPLAHAALMRDGAPGTLWSAFCNAAVAGPAQGQDGKPAPVPIADQDHSCCFGLAHAPALIAPSPSFTALPPVVATLAPSLPVEQSTPVGIRDGPRQPRGPPSLV
jgi:hypothetical protein